MTVLTDGLTNSQIAAVDGELRSDGRLLTGIQRQVRYLMRVHLTQKPCPNCGTVHSLPQAAGVYVDDFNFGEGLKDDKGRCSNCKRTLIYMLPLFGDWRWLLDHREAQNADEERWLNSTAPGA